MADGTCIECGGVRRHGQGSAKRQLCITCYSRWFRANRKREKTCEWCGEPFQAAVAAQRFCDRSCGGAHANSIGQTLTYQRTCKTCGADFTGTHTSKYCTALCREHGSGRNPSSLLPADHWAHHYGSTSEWPRPSSEPPFRACTCQECGARFIERAYSQAVTKWCSKACQRRVARRHRKAYEYNAPGTFRYTDLIRQYLRQGSTCAYCQQPCHGLPDPEHVIPISRGGRNDMSNIVAACRACNGDKRDLTPAEWALDRVRRGLPPRTTELDGPAYRHLWATPALQRAREAA